MDQICDHRDFNYIARYRTSERHEQNFVCRALIRCISSGRLTKGVLSKMVSAGEDGLYEAEMPLCANLLLHSVSFGHMASFVQIVDALSAEDTVLHRVWLYDVFGLILHFHNDRFGKCWMEYMRTWPMCEIMSTLQDPLSINAIVDMHAKGMDAYLRQLLPEQNALEIMLQCCVVAYNKGTPVEFVDPTTYKYADQASSILHEAILYVMLYSRVQWDHLCDVLSGLYPSSQTCHVYLAVKSSTLVQKQELLLPAAKYSQCKDKRVQSIVACISKVFRERPEGSEVSIDEATEMVSSPATMVGMLDFGVDLMQPLIITTVKRALVYWLIMWCLPYTQRDVLQALLEHKAVTADVLAYLTEDMLRSIHQSYAQSRPNAPRIDFLLHCVTMCKSPSLTSPCIVCTEKPRDYALLPCGHKMLCDLCVSLIQSCPVCRCDITGSLRIFE